MRKREAGQVCSEGQRSCRCEASIALSVLDGFACGNPECWRTAEAKASFDAFVTKLIRERGEELLTPGAKT